jgi:branched-chain amino acid transport system permease protein
MSTIFGIPSQALYVQLLIGLINGSFYAVLSLGLAVIFGMLHVVNFSHGAMYMLGAFLTWMFLVYLDVGYWSSLVIAPLVVAALGVAIEKTMLSRLYQLDPLYGLLLTFGIATIIEDSFRYRYGTSGLPYPMPGILDGTIDVGFMMLPLYRGWVIAFSLVACFATWLMIERSKFGSYLRAATEKPALVQAFGVNVPRLMTLTYALGTGLAALGGVLAAPIYQVGPLMGQNIIIIVFAVVVIGGMGSILGAIVTGYALGVLEGLTKVFYPEASSTVIFVAMVIVLLLRPNGLFGKQDSLPSHMQSETVSPDEAGRGWIQILALIAAIVILTGAYFLLYPVFVMNVLCFALFAASFNLLFGYAGLMSFGHAAFFGGAAYITAYLIKDWNAAPEIGILLGVVFATILGVVFGFVAIRRQGIYFAMITFALAQMFYFYCLQAPFTGGEDGIQGVPRGKLFGVISLGNPAAIYTLVSVISLFGFFAIWRIANSPFGIILKAIRDNEPRAISLGYRVERYKLAAFVMSAALTGLAGSAHALVFQLASLSEVTWHASGQVVLMTLVGGVGTMLGPIIGAAIVVNLQNYLASSGLPVQMVLGFIFVLCVLLFRRGIVGELNAWMHLRKMKVGKPLAGAVEKALT